MTPEEARVQLDVSTLRPQDSEVEAREWMAQNAELAEWVKRRTAFDDRIAQTMDEIPVPEGLRERLLVTASRVPAQRRISGIAVLLTLAALTMIAFLWGWLGPSKMPGWESESLAMVKAIDNQQISLDHFSGEINALKAFLAQSSSPVPGSLPKGFAPMASLGCKTFALQGRSASVICFEIAPGQEAHLVVFSNEGLNQPPPQHQPQFAQHGEWHVAKWSDGPQSLMIATKAPAEKLQSLFSLVFLKRPAFLALKV